MKCWVWGPSLSVIMDENIFFGPSLAFVASFGDTQPFILTGYTTSSRGGGLNWHSPLSSLSIWIHASITWTTQVVFHPSTEPSQCFSVCPKLLSVSDQMRNGVFNMDGMTACNWAIFVYLVVLSVELLLDHVDIINLMIPLIVLDDPLLLLLLLVLLRLSN